VEDRLKVFENRVLSRIFGLNREKVAGGWRRLHNKELHNLYASPNIIRLIISRRIRWMGNAESLEIHTIFLLEILTRRDHLGDTRIDGRIILKSILKEQDGKV
jgi:hypothetical protein